MNRKTTIRAAVACAAAVLPFSLGAHELLTADSVQVYLLRVTALQKILSTNDSREQRARASLLIGQTLDEIRDVLNSDLEAHGKVQGLTSNVLMNELTTQGAPLTYSARVNRFTANLSYYRDALRWAPSGAMAGEASFRLLAGQFYDAVGDDPLQPVAQSRQQLAEQIRLGEALRRGFPAHPQREETTFILAVHYMQAVKAATAPGERARYLGKARALVDEFGRAYPDSLRATTLWTLLDAVSGSS